MGAKFHFVFKEIRAACSVLALAAGGAAALLAGSPALAQSAVLAPGEPVVTGFSGVLPPADMATANPLDHTFINPDGSSMVVQRLQPDGPPAGQLVPATPAFTASARDIGQVFGVTLDDAPAVTGAAAPNIYLAATSAYGLDIVVPGTDGNPVRSRTGEPGAEFMPGLWGTAGGAAGTPGSIWKVDGVTGQISLFSTIAANHGPGLGDIVFDPATQQFFVSDLDTGLIYRLALDGTILDSFDHGSTGRPAHGLAAVADDGSTMDITTAAFNSEDPATWGFTQPERRVYGLAVHAGRLYYAVAEGPQIWSVGINLDGSFAADPRWELDIAGLPSTNEITNIVFDPEGRMILAQRGAVIGSYDYTSFADTKASSVVRYQREIPDDPATPGTWVQTPESYAIGYRPDGNNASGGIALGYGWDAKRGVLGGTCSAYLWSTGDSLRDDPAMTPPLAPPAQIHGLQGNDRSLVRPQDDPPATAWFADYDGLTGDDQAANQGHVGAVDIWQKCDGGYGQIVPLLPPPGYVPPPDGNLTLTKRARPETCYDAGANWLCGFTIRVKNTGPSTYWGPLAVDDWLPGGNPGASMAFVPQPPWSCSAAGPGDYRCLYPPVVLNPGDSIDLRDSVRLPKRGNDWCVLDNAASIDWPAGFHDANPADDADFASARIPDRRCSPPQGEKTNLKLTKIAHPQTCAQEGNGFDCTFYIRVTNTGPGDYNAPLQVKDTLPFPMAVTTGNAPWSCGTSGATVTCNYPTVLLHPGDSRTVRIVAYVPAAMVRERDICRIDNTARISAAPGGTSLNTDPSDDQAGANTLIPLDQCNPDRQRTDLSLTKTAIGCRTIDNGPAIAAFGGTSCVFEIRVKNEGPAGFTGPVTVHDAFAPAIAPANLIATPAICAPAGGGYDCTTPALTLAPGQSYAFFIGFRAGRDKGVCDVRNLARITSPAGGAPQNVNPANDTGSAVLHVTTPACTPVAPVCPIAQQMPNGKCCDDGLVWNGRQCAPPRDHKPPVVGPQCPADSQIVRGQCICDPGTHGDPGHCLPNGPGKPVRPIVPIVPLICPSDSHVANGKCVCDAGTIGAPGRCAPIRIVPLCPADSRWNADRKVCQCIPPTRGRPGNCKAPTDNGNDNGPGAGPGKVPGKGPLIPDGGIKLPHRPILVVPQCPADSHWNARSQSCTCDPPKIGRPGACELPAIRPQLQINPHMIPLQEGPRLPQIR